MFGNVLKHLRGYLPGTRSSGPLEALDESPPQVSTMLGTSAPDNALGSPESCVQPGLMLREDGNELEGELKITGNVRVSGGYAEIYHGVWESPCGDQVQVAVKVFKTIFPSSITVDPATLEERMEKRLKREILVWTRVEHPNIHPFLGFQSRPSPRLISPWCSNGNLKDYMFTNPDLSRLNKIKLIADVARGLVYLHSRSPPICHADIKPENVLVMDSCEAALSDFGLSRVLVDIGTPSGLTTGEGPRGSTHYMAPELFEEAKPRPTAKSDVFSFGGLVLAVMSGKHSESSHWDFPSFPVIQEVSLLRTIQPG